AGLVVWPLGTSPVAVDAAAPASPVGDPATADPCSLIPSEPLDRFGDTILEAESGNFYRCDVVIDSGPDRFTAQVLFVRSAPVLPEGVPEDREGIVIVRGTPVPGECVRTLRPPGGIDVRVIARAVTGPFPDPCAVADVTTESAFAVLARGQVPRRTSPFEPGSLATVDACGLLDTAAVAKVPGLEAATPDPGFAGWDCDWENPASGASVVVSYDRNRGTSRDGAKKQIAGHEATSRKDEDGNGCDVSVVHRSYTDRRGYPASELLTVKVDQAVPVPDPCVLGVEVATVAAERLPAAP
ncbi:MAG: hypothetical protein ACRDXB_14260, partial [Actinomycetes bacterium]